MKIKISYFYQIRFFKPNMIPISTCVSDPKWFHQNKNLQFTFFDKNGVINGLRCEELAPGSLCSGLCEGKEICKSTPTQCQFLKAYSLQLYNYFNIIDFFDRCQNIINSVQKVYPFKEEPIIVLIVYETPNNLCSERNTIIQYFQSYGINISELAF